MKQTGWMKLDELHVRDHRAGAPRHGYAVPGRDVRIGRVQINFSATAGREHDPVRANRFHCARFFVQNVHAQTTIFGREAELARRDQVHRHVVLQKIDMRLSIQFAQQRVLDFLASNVPHVQHASLGVAGLAPKIEFAMTCDFALVELQAKIDKFAYSLRTFGNDRADDFLVAKTGADFDRIAHV